MVQKELRRQHQKGNVIPLRLWTLCSAITQALKLMAADSEAASCSLKKEDPLYEDVPMSEEKEDEGETGGLHLGLRPNLRMIVKIHPSRQIEM